MVEPRKWSPVRELLHVYRGRFCFRLGAGIRCGGNTSFTITKGEKRSLEMGLDVSLPVPTTPGLSAKARIEYEHTFAQDLGPWPLGGCDSMFPVLCFDDAEVKIFRNRRLIKKYALSAYTETFKPQPGDHGWAYPNILRNDPLCDCHKAGEPSRVERQAEQTTETSPSITIVRPSFQQLFLQGGDDEDRETAARETADAFIEILAGDEDGEATGAIDERIGVVRVDGVVVWLSGADDVSDGPSLMLIPSEPSSVSRRVSTYEQELAPVVAIGRPTAASYCELRMLVQLGDDRGLREVIRDHAAIEVRDGLMVVWGEVDFAALEPDATGVIELELRDEAGQPTGYPVREAFAVDPLARTPAIA